jgi:spore germination protein GerM
VRTGPRRWLALGLALGLLVLGSCGIPGNGEPQAIPARDVPGGLLDPNPSSSTTLPESGATTTVTVYFLTRDGDSTVLKATEREVKTTDADMPGARIAALFAQPTPDEQDRGLTTAIPADTTLLRARPPAVDGDDLIIDVSSELFSVQGQDLANAFAQIVWTVSEIDGIDGVRFLSDGVEIAALDGEGTEQEGAVTTDDYRTVRPERT